MKNIPLNSTYYTTNDAPKRNDNEEKCDDNRKRSTVRMRAGMREHIFWLFEVICDPICYSVSVQPVSK